MLDEAATATQRPLCAAAATTRSLQSLVRAASRRRTTASRLERTGGDGGDGGDGGVHGGHGHQAGSGARPTTIRRSAHEGLRPTGPVSTTAGSTVDTTGHHRAPQATAGHHRPPQGGWAVLKFCWRGRRRRCVAASSRCPRAPACMPAAHSVAQTPQTSFLLPLPRSSSSPLLLPP